jgi:tetratricopeptide (TPR) repeat protein
MPYVQQTAGGNGPASLEIALSYWGYTDTQDIIRAAVQPGDLDTTVEPEELAEYARSRQLTTYLGVNGDQEILVQFLASQFPVLVTRWITAQEQVEARQYQVIRGYDQEADAFTLHDSALGPDIEMPYADLDAGWYATGRQYLVALPPQHADLLRTLIDWDEDEMWEAALARAKDQAAQNAEDAYAWLNQANALVALDRCEQASLAFERAQEIGLPATLAGHQLRILGCLIDLGEHDTVLAVTGEAIAAGPVHEWLYLYRAQAYAVQGDADQARAQYQRALDIHPDWAPAQEGMADLPE